MRLVGSRSTSRFFHGPAVKGEGFDFGFGALGRNLFAVEQETYAGALPTLTVISWAARMAVLAGAIRVSWTTGCPSAMTAIQEVSDARILRVKTGGALAAGAAPENFRTETSRSEEERSEEDDRKKNDRRKNGQAPQRRARDRRPWRECLKAQV